MSFQRLAQLLLLLTGLCLPAFAQGFKSELEAPEKVSLVVKNLDGRVSVVASEEQQKKVTIDARSTGLEVAPDDVTLTSSGATSNPVERASRRTASTSSSRFRHVRRSKSKDRQAQSM